MARRPEVSRVRLAFLVRLRRPLTLLLGTAMLVVVGPIVGFSGTAAGGRLASNRLRTLPPTALPVGKVVTLKVAGDLASSSEGALYLASPDQHEIVVRLADGRFAVVAGDGKPGTSGNGGPALDATLTAPYDLTSGPDGTLWFVDQGRVQVIDTDGIVHTVAGNRAGGDGVPGTPPTRPVVNGSPALTTSLGAAPYIALAPNGALYLDTSTQLLRLGGGRLETVATRQQSLGAPLPRSLDMNLGYLAVDGGGDLDVSGFNGWGVWRVSPDGAAKYIGYARQSGGSCSELVRAPDGAVYAESGSVLLRLGKHALVPTYNLNGRIDGEYFFMTSYAFGPKGTIYADEIPGSGGFEAHEQLIALAAGHVTLLWLQANKER